MSDEAWRQAIAKAEILLSEGEAEEDISGIADAVSAFNARAEAGAARRGAAGLGQDAEPTFCRAASAWRADRRSGDAAFGDDRVRPRA